LDIYLNNETPPMPELIPFRLLPEMSPMLLPPLPEMSSMESPPM